jgi:hypothetical protein
MPLPGNEALPVKDLNAVSRVVALRLHASTWPVKNRSVFYTDGRYDARLPVGQYDLVVARGPEYRFARQQLTIAANKTKHIKVILHRWRDMATSGWYSGEDHIHYTRESEHDDHDLGVFTEAEDLNVANILQMGNIAATGFAQRNWKPIISERAPSFVLVPGQEDPRTSYRGHTIQLNLKRPVRKPTHYLLYHEVFEDVRTQGGLTGYAHVNPLQDEGLNEVTGMAIDVPFGLVDFAEIFSLHFTDESIWFDFLNLGYKIAPSAGTDYPWGDVPGAVRNYVKIDGAFTPQAWFTGLKQGHTFVTSGAVLELTINGQGMGSEIRVKNGDPLMIRARAEINPDMGAISWLELIEQGGPVKVTSSEKGAPALQLDCDLPAKHGTWFVVRAHGPNKEILAESAPIYVFVDGQGFWSPAEVPAIVAKLKRRMQALLGPYQVEACCEDWETREPNEKYWDAQQGALMERIHQAAAIYDDLVKRAAAASSRP